MLREGYFDFTNRALQIYWVRKRSAYRRLVPMNNVDAANLLLGRCDTFDGIGSDTAWGVLLTRKPEKYEKWI